MDAAIHTYRTPQQVPLTSAGLLYTPPEWNHSTEGHGEKHTSKLHSFVQCVTDEHFKDFSRLRAKTEEGLRLETNACHRTQKDSSRITFFLIFILVISGFVEQTQLICAGVFFLFFFQTLGKNHVLPFTSSPV